MTRAEINTMIEGLGLPYAYYEFPTGTKQAPPFLCFWYETGGDFFADGGNYAKIETLGLEFYSDLPDFDKEQEIGGALNAHGLTYDYRREFIKDQRMWMTVFLADVCIDTEREVNTDG